MTSCQFFPKCFPFFSNVEHVNTTARVGYELSNFIEKDFSLSEIVAKFRNGKLFRLSKRKNEFQNAKHQDWGGGRLLNFNSGYTCFYTSASNLFR